MSIVNHHHVGFPVPQPTTSSELSSKQSQVALEIYCTRECSLSPSFLHVPYLKNIVHCPGGSETSSNNLRYLKKETAYVLEEFDFRSICSEPPSSLEFQWVFVSWSKRTYMMAIFTHIFNDGDSQSHDPWSSLINVIGLWVEKLHLRFPEQASISNRQMWLFSLNRANACSPYVP